MNERYENDYENTANQWEETTEGGRVTYRERSPREDYSANDTEPETSRPARRRAYEPTGARQYRTSSRPNRTRGTRQTAPAGGEAVGTPSRIQPILLLVVALLAVISIINGIASCAANMGGSQGEAAVTPQATQTDAAANVEAAEKTTDEKDS